MNLWDDLAAMAVPLIWILVLIGRFIKNRKQKRDYYAPEEKDAENKPIHPDGTNW